MSQNTFSAIPPFVITMDVFALVISVALVALNIHTFEALPTPYPWSVRVPLVNDNDDPRQKYTPGERRGVVARS